MGQGDWLLWPAQPRGRPAARDIRGGARIQDLMTDFDFAPPAPGAYDPDLPAGGKIPRSSMGPTIALRHGKPIFSIGAAGGSTIITTVLQTRTNHVDFGM